MMFRSYIGNKKNMYWRIRDCLDTSCNTYVETCGGGLGVYSSLPNSLYKNRIVNEADKEMANLYRAIQNKENMNLLINKINDIDVSDIAKCKSLFEEAKERLNQENECNNDVCIERAFCKFIIHSMSRNCAGENFVGKYIERDYISRNIKRVREMHNNLNFNTEIRNINCIDLVKEYSDKQNVMHFVDPPYIGIYRTRAIYFREMMSLVDHIDLCNAIRNSAGKFIVCGYRNPVDGIPTMYDAFLGDKFKCYLLKDTYKSCAMGKHGQKKSKAYEFIWTNVENVSSRYFTTTDYSEHLSLVEFFNQIEMKEQMTRKEKLEYERAYVKCNELKLI